MKLSDLHRFIVDFSACVLRTCFVIGTTVTVESIDTFFFVYVTFLPVLTIRRGRDTQEIFKRYTIDSLSNLQLQVLYHTQVISTIQHWSGSERDSSTYCTVTVLNYYLRVGFYST